MLLPLFHDLQVQSDADHQLLRFQWLNPANSVLRPALAHGRDLVVQHQPTHVLVDFTGLPPLSIQDEMWMPVHWFPRIAAQPLRNVALVFRPEHLHNQMATEAMFWVGRHLLGFSIQIFPEPEMGLHWLVGGDGPALERLQAEWNAALPSTSPRALSI